MREREFAQERSKRTYEAVLDAAQEVFTEHGYDGATVPGIADRAGVGIGTFYRYFEDKREAFLEVAQRRDERGSEEIRASLVSSQPEEASYRERVAIVVDIVFDYYAKHARFDAHYLAMALKDPEVAALREKVDRQGREFLTQLLTDYVPNPKATAFVTQTALLQVAQTRALWPSWSDDIPESVARRAMTDMAYAFLSKDAPAT